jgi:cell division protein FtsN
MSARLASSRASRLALAGLLSIASTIVAAEEPSLAVERVAAPAQLQRASTKYELETHRRLLAGDRIVTGAQGRASFDFIDGTLIRLGADSSLEVPQQSPITLTSRMAVLKLALNSGTIRIDGRRSTAVPQDVRLTLGDVRLRTEGGDVWAQVSGKQKTICVLAGTVELQGINGYDRLQEPGECLQVDTTATRRLMPDRLATTQRLSQLAFADELPATQVAQLQRPAQPAARPVPLPIPPPKPIAPEQQPDSVIEVPAAAAAPIVPVRSLASSEVQRPVAAPAAAPVAAARPAVMPAASQAAAVANPPATATPGIAGDHGWTLVAASLADGESARLEAKGLADMGLSAQVRTLLKDGQTYYRVTIGNFASRAEAASYADQLKQRYGMAQVWLANY